MNISSRPDPLATPVAAPVSPVRPDAAPPEGERSATGATASADARDRVEISAAGRAQAASSVGEANADLDTARVALRAGADLDAAQLHALRSRVRDGHYDQPEVIGRVAEAAARNGASPLE